MGGCVPLGVSRPAMTGRGPRPRPPPARSGSSHSSGGGSPSAAPLAAGRGPARRRSKRSTRASNRAMARQPRASTPSSTASPISSRHRGSESLSRTPETADTAPAPSRIDPATASARGARARSGYAAPEVTGPTMACTATRRNKSRNPPECDVSGALRRRRTTTGQRSGRPSPATPASRLSRYLQRCSRAAMAAGAARAGRLGGRNHAEGGSPRRSRTRRPGQRPPRRGPRRTGPTPRPRSPARAAARRAAARADRSWARPGRPLLGPPGRPLLGRPAGLSPAGRPCQSALAGPPGETTQRVPYRCSRAN